MIIAQFSESQANYSLTLSPAATTITDRRADGNGTDTLIDVEPLDFGTEVFDFLNPAVGLELTRFAGTAALSVEQFESFIELYIAL